MTNILLQPTTHPYFTTVIHCNRDKKSEVVTEFIENIENKICYPKYRNRLSEQWTAYRKLYSLCTFPMMLFDKLEVVAPTN